MRKSYHLFFTLAILICTAGRSSAQGVPQPIPGHLYGQAIVACSEGRTESVATSAAIYSRPASVNANYARVWTAPGALTIVSFSVERSGHRAILLRDGSGNFFVAYTQINASGPDLTIHAPVLLPTPIIGGYTKIVAGVGIYVYSFLNGGPAGNLTVSRDNGQTWALDTAGIGLDAVNDVAIDTADNVLIAGQNAVYRQLPTDSAWTLLSAVPNTSVIFVDHLNRILTSNYGVDTRISVNNGLTFSSDNTGLSWQVTKICDDALGNLYLIAGGTLYKNSGGNSTWSSINAPFNLATGSASIQCMSGDSLLTFGTGKGMYSSTDFGSTWTATNTGIDAEDIFSITKLPDLRLVCTTDLGIFYKDDADTLWHQSAPITTFYPGNLLSSNPAGEVFVAVGPTAGSPYPLGKSVDGGVTFTVDSDGFSAIGGAGFLMDENGNRHFYNYYATAADNMTVWTSPFGGSTFSPDTAGMPLFTSFGLGVKDMCGDHRGYLYASLDLLSGVTLYRRAMAGTVWSPDTAGLGAASIISPMASSAALGLVVASGSDCYRRAASGWIRLSPIPGTTSNGGVNALSVDAHGLIYLSYSNYSYPDSNAVYYSTDSGSTWHTAGLGGMNVYNLIATGDTTYAVTLGRRGYFYAGGGANGITPIAAQSPVIKVFPNPSASGQWTLQAGEEWSGSHIEISDVDGRIVYSAIANKTDTQISAPGLASGVYVLHVFNAVKSASAWLVK